MDQDTRSGTVIYTTNHIPITIDSWLAEGGQGHVFKVTYQGKPMALKWYKPHILKNEAKFRSNLIENASHRSPDPCFLWPQAVTEYSEGSFGYLMDLRSEGFRELADFRNAKVQFGSLKAGVEACLRICNAFRILHNSGYCYQDLNDGNIFINPKTGEVQICDNDNAAPNKTDAFIMGTPRFMAPEVVRGEEQPNTQSDRFSLAVILFIILFGNHPLEGKQYLCPCLTAEKEMKLYGTCPTFIFDPASAENRPDKAYSRNVLSRWPYVPQYIRDAFLQAFSQEALMNPKRRKREIEWVTLLARFEHDITRCPHCGNEVYITNPAGTRCDTCRAQVCVPYIIHLPGVTTSAVKGNRIYRIQLGLCSDDEALDEIARIVAASGVLYCKNTSAKSWNASGSQGRKKVAPGEYIPLENGLTVTTTSGEFSFEKI